MAANEDRTLLLEVDELSGALNYASVDIPSAQRSQLQAGPAEHDDEPGTSGMNTENHHYIGEKQVIGTRFLSDPCELPHVCTPSTVANLALRTSYKVLRDLRSDPNASSKPPLRHYLDTIRSIDQDATLENDLRVRVVDEYRGDGFSHKKRAIRKACSTGHTNPVTMDNIPSYLANLWDGSAFLQVKEHGMHVYISDSSIEKACKNALSVLVADAVHSKAPRCVKKGSQLYVIHGVCRGGFDVPLLYAIMEKKDKQAYETVLTQLKTHLLRFGADLDGLHIVVDYKRAAIAAIRTIFERSTLQGCSFHLALAWKGGEMRSG
ncbi:unnamed protein product [Cylicocyclus nassatus]|uniref:MULE transposase domain-containing protein n=1 Tax=Cylicocyclus nassatus TaxID=53992 RepID=A0AA36MH62_CYLNA|nr:unnamed protein product [Cylicocyclus nassatus]